MNNSPSYSRLDAFDEGFLQVSDLHTIHYEQSCKSVVGMGGEHFLPKPLRG